MSNREITKLILSPVSGSDWELMIPFVYWINKEKDHYILIPKGFITNFASVPRVLWSVISPWGNHGEASVIHDYLYTTRLVKRYIADRIFLTIMEEDNVPFIKRYMMYYAVRIFGFYEFAKSSERDRYFKNQDQSKLPYGFRIEESYIF